MIGAPFQVETHVHPQQPYGSKFNALKEAPLHSTNTNNKLTTENGRHIGSLFSISEIVISDVQDVWFNKAGEK